MSQPTAAVVEGSIQIPQLHIRHWDGLGEAVYFVAIGQFAGPSYGAVVSWFRVTSAAEECVRCGAQIGDGYLVGRHAGGAHYCTGCVVIEQEVRS